MLWTVPLIILCMVIATGSGIWFAALFVRYRDVRHLMPFIVQFGLYLSPVGFASSVVPPKWRLLFSINPMVGVIDGFRWALFGSSNPLNVASLVLSIVVSLAMLVGGVCYFRTTEREFADII
jgi:lipopolysaccharide transport system permease protein